MMSCLFSDELCENVTMGGMFSVIGIPIYELSESGVQAHINITVEVCPAGRGGGWSLNDCFILVW